MLTNQASEPCGRKFHIGDLDTWAKGECMVNIPEEVLKVVNDITAIKTIATLFPNERRVHTIQMGSLMAVSADRLIFGRVLTKRSHANLVEMMTKGELVSVLINLEKRSYEIMAKPLEYAESGEMLDKVNDMLKPIGVKAFGVWTLEPIEVWNQCPGPWAGNKMT
jgi:hypothetical protein